MTRIADPTDERLRPYRGLKDRALQLEQEGLFIGESPLVVERMLASGLTESVLVAEGHEAWAREHLVPGVELFVAPEALVSAIAGYRVHRGVLALGRRPVGTDGLAGLRLPEAGPCTVLVLEDLTDVENVGLAFRTAAAFGVAAVVLSPRCHDPLYRRALRVAMGYTLRMPWARATAWPGDLGLIKAQGLTLVGAATDPGSTPLDDAHCPARVAVAVGAEHAGLSEGVLALCDQLVRIPMAPGVDSLNVGVATGIVLHRLSQGRRV